MQTRRDRPYQNTASCSIFLKIAACVVQKSFKCLSIFEGKTFSEKKRISGSSGDLLCWWHLYLLSVTSLFNIFVWRLINKKRRPRLGRDPSKFNLCVHKALHLSKWHFPISAFDSIDFFSPHPSTLQPFSMHGWNNKGSWAASPVWTEHSGALCCPTVETETRSIKPGCYAPTIITTIVQETRTGQSR